MIQVAHENLEIDISNSLDFLVLSCQEQILYQPKNATKEM